MSRLGRRDQRRELREELHRRHHAVRVGRELYQWALGYPVPESAASGDAGANG